MKLRSTAMILAGALALGLALAPAAIAEEPEGGGDLKERIKKKMERILELMKKNEEALLELSTGGSAKTKKVDVPVPPGDEGKGGAAGSEKSGEASGSDSGKSASGGSAAEELRKLVEKHRKDGGQIPAELRELVEMIPL